MQKNLSGRKHLLTGRGLALLGVLLALGLAACAPTLSRPSVSPTPSLPPTSPVVASPTQLPPTEAPTPTVTEVPSPTPTPVLYRTSFPDPAAYLWAPIASGFSQPVDIQHAGDRSDRLFIVEKVGRIRILVNGLTLPDAFLDIRNRVGSRGYEQGLLGLAFHPDFAHNGYFYVNYTDKSGNTVVSRFQVSADDPNRADPQSEVVLLRVKQPYANHNGGGLVFGPDGLLYIGLGDGGSAGDPQGYAQNPQTYLGKMLRLDVNAPQPQPEIWGLGLRNPWRYSFDSLTGDLYIADVGQNLWEEIHFVPAGTLGPLNFGWDFYEGTHPFEGQPPAGASLVMPVAEYSHEFGRCSITGGYVYRGPSLPEWQGVYFFADFCSREVFGLIRSDDTTWRWQPLFAGVAQASTFGLDQVGEIYLADYASGQILRLMRR